MNLLILLRFSFKDPIFSLVVAVERRRCLSTVKLPDLYALTTLNMPWYSNVFFAFFYEGNKLQKSITHQPIGQCFGPFRRSRVRESKWHLAPSMRVKWAKTLNTNQSVHVWGYIVSSTLHVVTFKSCIYRNYKIYLAALHFHWFQTPQALH